MMTPLRGRMKKYVYPEPACDPSALQSHRSGWIVELHHAKHHAACMDGANATLEKLAVRPRSVRTFELVLAGREMGRE